LLCGGRGGASDVSRDRMERKMKIGVKTDGTSVRRGMGRGVGCGSSELQCTAWDESTVKNGSSSLVSHRINEEY